MSSAGFEQGADRTACLSDSSGCRGDMGGFTQQVAGRHAEGPQAGEEQTDPTALL